MLDLLRVLGSLQPKMNATDSPISSFTAAGLSLLDKMNSVGPNWSNPMVQAFWVLYGDRTAFFMPLTSWHLQRWCWL